MMAIKKYRKKAVEVEAVQLTKSNTNEVLDWVINKIDFNCTTDGTFINIITLEGTMQAHISDYIIKGVEGEFYPCKERIFEKTYIETDSNRAILEYKLPENKQDLEIALKGLDFSLALWDIQQYFREQLRYNESLTDEELNTIEKTRDKFLEILQDHNIILEDYL